MMDPFRPRDTGIAEVLARQPYPINTTNPPPMARPVRIYGPRDAALREARD